MARAFLHPVFSNQPYAQKQPTHEHYITQLLHHFNPLTIDYVHSDTTKTLKKLQLRNPSCSIATSGQ